MILQNCDYCSGTFWEVDQHSSWPQRNIIKPPTSTIRTREQRIYWHKFNGLIKGLVFDDDSKIFSSMVAEASE
jgi:hypothetical protein